LTFSQRLKRALVDDTTARFVYLSNFEVEREWAKGEPRLPGADVNFTAATVNRMEEMGVFLADDGDVVLLKEPPDPAYRSYLSEFGITSGQVLSPEESEPARLVTDDILASPGLLDRLRGLADGRTYLVPLGVSENVELLARQTGLPLATPSASVYKAVNSKVFGRALVDRVGLMSVPGASCTLVDQVVDAVERFLRPAKRVVVKEALGVSGRGMAVLDDPARAARFLRLMARKTTEVDVVVEEWIDKVEDLNYQFVIDRDGSVEFETVKAAVVEAGVHRGHRFPGCLPEKTLTELHRAADVIGGELFEYGFDFVTGAGVLALGHNHPALVAAAHTQLDVHTQGLDFPTQVKDDFTDLLFGTLPVQMRDRLKVHFCGPTGADGVDAAIKLCKTRTGRGGVISFDGGFDGSTQSTLALSGLGGKRRDKPAWRRR
jgi:hypothetical protein